MKQLVQQKAEDAGGVQAYAAKVGGSKSIFSNWLRKPNSRMAIAQLLDIAWIEGVSLASLLQGEWVPIEMPESDRKPLRRRRAVKRVDHQRLRQAMAEAITQGKTASEVARAMQVDLSTMRRHEDLYMQMRGNTITNKQAEDENRRTMAVCEAEQIAIDLIQSGQTLSLRNASAAAGTKWYPSQLRAQALRAIAATLESGNTPSSLRIGATTLRLATEAAERIRIRS